MPLDTKFVTLLEPRNNNMNNFENSFSTFFLTFKLTFKMLIILILMVHYEQLTLGCPQLTINIDGQVLMNLHCQELTVQILIPLL